MRFIVEEDGYVRDIDTGAMWSIVLDAEVDFKDVGATRPSVEDLTKILADELNIVWPLKEYHNRWDDIPLPANVGVNMYAVHHVVARPGKLTFACSEKALSLAELKLFGHGGMHRFCLSCTMLVRETDKRAEMLLPDEFVKLKEEA